jgi:hypothetical protein
MSLSHTNAEARPRRIRDLALVILVVAVAGVSLGLSALESSEITRWVVASGGGLATSSSHGVQGTVGQSFIGRGTSQHAIIDSGFWPPQPGTVTGVPGVETPLPAVYDLHPNLPNPFNPRTTIQYDLPKATHVRLRVYDLAGRLVRTLVDGVEAPGRRSVVWDGVDHTGTAVASGTYVAVLNTPDYEATQKMTLVR